MREFESIRLREKQETKPKPKSTAYVVAEKTDSNLVINDKLTEYQPFKKQLKPDVKNLIYYDYELKRWVLQELEK